MKVVVCIVTRIHPFTNEECLINEHTHTYLQMYITYLSALFVWNMCIFFCSIFSTWAYTSRRSMKVIKLQIAFIFHLLVLVVGSKSELIIHTLDKSINSKKSQTIKKKPNLSLQLSWFMECLHRHHNEIRQFMNLLFNDLVKLSKCNEYAHFNIFIHKNTFISCQSRKKLQ